MLNCSKRSGFSTDSPFSPGDVIEVQGPAASGKTHLLYHLAARCLLPNEISIPAKCTVHVGGWQSSVVVLDCDAGWNLIRLYNIIAARLSVACGKENALLIDIPAIAMESLSRLHIFRPQSSIQLAATLENLPAYHTEKMPEEDLRFLFVDSISSFHWMDKWELEPSTSKASPSRASPLGLILRSLQLLKVSHAPITVLTNWGLYPATFGSSPDKSPDVFFKQHLVPPYPSPFDTPPRIVLSKGGFQVDIHITLAGVLVKNPSILGVQPEQTSSHEAPKPPPKDRRKKGEIDIEVQGYVRMSSIDRERLNSDESFGIFKFRILKQDVVSAGEAPD